MAKLGWMAVRLGMLAAAAGRAVAQDTPVEEAGAVSEQATPEVRNCDIMDLFSEGEAVDLNFAVIPDHCTRINLWNCKMETNGSIALAQAFEETEAKSILTHIDLGYNAVSEEGAIAIANGLKHLTALEWLNFNGNKECSNKGFTAILLQAAEHPTLKSLDMGANYFGPGVVPAVVTLLETNPRIDELWINTNDMGASGGDVLTALASNTGLKKLQVSSNQMSDAVSGALDLVLARNRVLKKLDVGNNGLTDETAKAISTSLSINNVLKSIDFDSNKITDSGARALVVALERNVVLKELWLTSNSISNDGLRKQFQGVATEENVHIRRANARRLSRPKHTEL